MDQYNFKETTTEFTGLHLNESQIDHPQEVADFLTGFDISYHSSKYKSFDYVRDDIAFFNEVPKSFITLTNGCDHALELIIARCRNIHYPQEHHYSFLDKITANYNVKTLKTFESLPHTVVYYANPNNPNGKLVSAEEIEAQIEMLGEKSKIIIDETYIDYAGLEKSLIPLVHKHNNVFILRSFSKGFGLAGLRLGYIVSQTNYQHTINPKSFSPFTGVIPIVLKNYSYYRTQIDAIMQIKENLVANIRKIIGDRFNIENGYGNFFTIACSNPALVSSLFYTHFILIRNFDTFVRISAPKEEDAAKILSIIELAYKTGNFF